QAHREHAPRPAHHPRRRPPPVQALRGRPPGFRRLLEEPHGGGAPPLPAHGFVVTLPALAGGTGVVLAGSSGLTRGLASVLCLVLSASLAFFGVQIYRIDFRLDLDNIDLLKSYPLRGRDLALAEVLA